MLKNCMLLLLGLMLSSCNWLFGDEGYFRDRQGDYLTAPVEPVMQIPGNLDSYTLDQLYVVPEAIFTSGDMFAARIPRPKPIPTNQAEGVIIQRIGGESWIVVAAQPQQAWPRVRDFWAESAVPLEYENPQDGVMDTIWIDGPNDSPNQSKFRIRIEPGLRPGSSEIYAYYIEEPRSTVGQQLPVWPERSLSEGLGSELLDRLSQYLADRTDIYSSSSSSLLAGNLTSASKAAMVSNAQGNQVLEISIGFTRAWAQLGQALERADITVLDSNRDEAVYTVRFAGDQSVRQSPGFFSRIFGRGGDDLEGLPEFTITVETTDTGVRFIARAKVDDDVSRQLETDLLTVVHNNIG
jgi:outer membrane protein assembly factor BamC